MRRPRSEDRGLLDGKFSGFRYLGRYAGCRSPFCARPPHPALSPEYRGEGIALDAVVLVAVCSAGVAPEAVLVGLFAFLIEGLEAHELDVAVVAAHDRAVGGVAPGRGLVVLGEVRTVVPVRKLGFVGFPEDVGVGLELGGTVAGLGGGAIPVAADGAVDRVARQLVDRWGEIRLHVEGATVDLGGPEVLEECAGL